MDQILRFGIIIGAMKAGTTAAFQALGQHKEVALSREKELNFFVTDEMFNQGISYYEAQWNWDSSNHKIAVEASPRLTQVPKYSGGPIRIASTDRDIRLVYFVRDPIRRIQSQYVMHAAKKWPITPLSEGVDQNALSYSSYHAQISQYAKLLPRKKILVLTFEHLIEQTQLTLQKICEHFEIPCIQFSLPKANLTQDEYLRPLLIQSLAEQGIEIPDTSVDGFRHWFPRIPSVVRKQCLRLIQEHLSLTEEHCQYITQRLASDMRALHRDYGINVNAWGFSI